MARFTLKKGDTVLVIAGKDRGKQGVVERTMPADNKILVTGINLMTRHLKKTQANPIGGIVKKPAPLHRAKVMLIDPSTGKPTRISKVRNEDGTMFRAARATKASVEKN
jgi:large subunit ribosomal protein L24